jgi:SAM-dependent methyltransferase
MNKTQDKNDALRNSRLRFLRWYRSTPAGVSLQACEGSLVCGMLKGTYNEQILQVESFGAAQYAARNELYARIIFFNTGKNYDNAQPLQVQGEMNAFPFADDSMDKVILPHVLEFENMPQAVLDECVRVLKPEGALILFAFNPWRLKALRLLFAYTDYHYYNNTIHRALLEKWLHKLECDTTLAAGLDLGTPCSIFHAETSWWQRVRAHFSAVYALKAHKRRFNPITPLPVSTGYANILPGCVPEISLLRKRTCQTKKL